MQKTEKKTTVLLSERLAVSQDELPLLLGCGKKTAIEIGEKAQARCVFGRRVLYNAAKVRAYLDKVAE